MKKRITTTLLAVAILLPLLLGVAPKHANAAGSTETVENLVAFVSFSENPDDDFATEATLAPYKALFNSVTNGNTTNPTNVSFERYISVMTNDNIAVNDHFVHITLTGSSDDYKGDGLEDDYQFVTACIQALDNEDLSAFTLDNDGDRRLDHLVLIPYVESADRTGSAFYPHHATYVNADNKIAGLGVSSYNVIYSGALASGSMLKQGVISHEFLHSMGLPDLYRNGGNTAGVPVGQWDIMAATGYYQQFPLTYLRYKMGWMGDTIPTLAATSSGTTRITLNAVTATSGDRALLITTPLSSTESIVLEYRKKGKMFYEDTYGFETKIPGSGLLCYRVDDAVEGHTNTAGNNYLYVYRPNTTDLAAATEVTDGGLSETWNAAIDPAIGETNYGSTDLTAAYTADTLFYSNGQNSGILISNIAYKGTDQEQIEFDITFADYESGGAWPQIGGNLPLNAYSAPTLTAVNGTLYTFSVSDSVSDDGSGQVYRLAQNGGWEAMGTSFSGVSAGTLKACANGLYLAYIGSNRTTIYTYRWNDANLQWEVLGSWTPGQYEITYLYNLTLLEKGTQPLLAYTADVKDDSYQKLFITDTSGTVQGTAANANTYSDNQFTSPGFCVFQGSIYAAFGIGTSGAKVARLDDAGWTTVFEQSNTSGNSGGSFYISASDSGISLFSIASGPSPALYTSDTGADGSFTEAEGLAALMGAGTRPLGGAVLQVGNVPYVAFCEGAIDGGVSGKERIVYYQNEKWQDHYGVIDQNASNDNSAMAADGNDLYVAYLTSGETSSQIVRVRPLASTVTEPSTPPVVTPQLVVTLPSGYSDSTIYLDGTAYAGSISGSTLTLQNPPANVKTAIAYKYNANKIPIGMYVWTIQTQGQNFTATPVADLENILSYEGIAMRVGGAFGLRIKTGIDEKKRASLLGSGLAGYKMVECGTLAMSTARNQQGYPLILNGEKTIKGVAYGTQGGKFYDAIFETKYGRHRFTSVLVGVQGAQYSTEFLFRGYICLQKDGQTVTLYGPPISRSMYFVATQLVAGGSLVEGTAAYDTVYNVIKTVENG